MKTQTALRSIALVSSMSLAAALIIYRAGGCGTITDQIAIPSRSSSNSPPTQAAEREVLSGSKSGIVVKPTERREVMSGSKSAPPFLAPTTQP